jgi:hypothetical protein
LIEEVTTQSTDKDNLKYPTTNSTNRSSFTQRDHTPINNGTLRIAIHWKPENYNELFEDKIKWTIQAEQMIKDIFSHPTAAISMVPRQEKSIISDRMIPTPH